MQIRLQLREGDAERRVQYSQWLLGKPQAFMSQIIIEDEAIFQLNGYVSNHNVVRYKHHVVIHLKTCLRQTLLWRKACMDQFCEE